MRLNRRIMDLDDFSFDLPERLIALRPVEPRSAARLLVAAGGETHHARVGRLGEWLRTGDCLVFNDTRVIPARLRGVRRRESPNGPGEAKIEVTLIRRAGPAAWDALARPAKRLAPGDRIAFQGLSAEVEAREGGEVRLVFDKAGPDLDRAVGAAGEMPLPPYIAGRRAADARDREDYQTVYAAREGAVAAPTAGLHFDAPLLASLRGAGIGMAHLTLHVGAGTFLPIIAERIEDHRMHAEWGEIGPETAAALNCHRAAGGRLIAVGTTALRLLESAADEAGQIHPFAAETEIFIRPGYRFRGVDGLMTNFHLPRSTLFMLVSALMGLERMQGLYRTAIEEGYRFYSYGDASLLLPDRA